MRAPALAVACAAAALAACVIGCQARPSPAAGAAKPAGSVQAVSAGAGPELYGAGVFTTGAWDFFMAFSPDQKHVLFCRADDRFSVYDIYETRLDAAGRWSTPKKPSFAAQYGNADPHFYRDGKAVVYISNRPNPGETKARDTFDIWSVERLPDGGWGEPVRLPDPVNDPAVDEFSPSIAANGNLYFGSEHKPSLGGSDLWLSRLEGGAYRAPENLGDAINTAADEVEPWIAPDESYMLFSALRRKDGLGRYDLYVSRKAEGRWQKARPLGGVNTPESEFNHSVSPDGEWLYFSSTRRLSVPLGLRFDVPRNDAAVVGIGDGKGDIYRVRMSALNLGG